MNRRPRAVAVVLALALVASGCTKVQKPKTSSYTVTVDRPDDYKLGDDVTVTVPEGAVKPGTKLHLNNLQTVSPVAAAPLQGVRQSAVTFDLSLDGDTQPSKPLGISIAVRGAFLPPGADARNALLYTGMPHDQWRLVAATFQSSTLQASLTHLSPKAIVYLDANGVKQMIQGDAQNMAPPANGCGKEVTTEATGKVMFGAGNKGWADGGDSPVQPCLEIKDGKPSLKVTNRANYLLSVYASKGVTIRSDGGDVDDRAVMLLAGLIIKDPILKAYLPRESSLAAGFGIQSLPGKVRLNANPYMIQVEAIWKVILLTLEVVTGEVSEKIHSLVAVALKLTSAALGSKSLAECLTASTNLPVQPDRVAENAIEIVLGVCGEALVTALAFTLSDSEASLKPVVKRLEGVFRAAGAVKDELELIAMAIESARINGDIEITLKMAGPTCPTAGAFFDLLRQHSGMGAVRFSISGKIVCEGVWAIAVVNMYYANGQGTNDTPLIRWVDGRWIWFEGGTDPQDKHDHCSEYSTAVKQYLHCPM